MRLSIKPLCWSLLVIVMAFVSCSVTHMRFLTGMDVSMGDAGQWRWLYYYINQFDVPRYILILGQLRGTP